MSISKLKLVWSLLWGGKSGCIKFLLSEFNKQVLCKIQNKDQALVSLKDIQAFTTFVNAIVYNHSTSISEEMKNAISSLVRAFDYLADALADFTIDEAEFSDIVLMAKNAIQAIKDAAK